MAKDKNPEAPGAPTGGQPTAVTQEPPGQTNVSTPEGVVAMAAGQAGTQVPAQPPAQQPAPQVNPAAAGVATMSEAERAIGIMNLARDHGLGDDWVRQSIQGGVTMAECNRQALALLASRNTPVPVGAGRVQVGDNLGIATLGSAVEDGLLMRARVERLVDVDPITMSAVDHTFCERGREFARLGMVMMGRRWLHSLGVRDVMSQDDVTVARAMLSDRIQLAQMYPEIGTIFMATTTSTWAEITRNVINKAAASAYVLLPQTWQVWAKRRVVNDFREISTIRGSDAPDYEELPENQELSFKAEPDAREKYNLKRWAIGRKISFQTLLADDLGFANDEPQRLAAKGLQKADAAAYGALTSRTVKMSDNTACWTSAHGNILTGTGNVGAPSCAMLDKARLKLAAQTGPGGGLLNLQIAHLITSVAVQGTAEKLAASTADPAASQSGVENNWRGRFKVTSHYLIDVDNAAASKSYWYALCDYRAGGCDTVEVAFLRGNEMPQIEVEREFGTGNLKLAGVFAVAAKMIDWRSGVRNDGA